MLNSRVVAGLVTAVLVITALAAGYAAAGPLPAADPAALVRAGWLMERSGRLPGLAGAPLLLVADEGTGGAGPAPGRAPRWGGKMLPLAMSLVMPGLGEAYLGHVRGYALMAIDVAGWIGVAHDNTQGLRKREEYYRFADQHWSEARLAAAYGGDVTYPGTFYFGANVYTDIPLWISKAADPREYYENLGKWDQFVFGWEDFTDPREFGAPATTESLRNDPRVSALRESYRALRQESNRMFTNRDRLVYFNMFTRLFSLCEVAWLEGLFGGGHKDELAIAGHPVRIIADPVGLTSSRIGVSVAY